MQSTLGIQSCSFLATLHKEVCSRGVETSRVIECCLSLQLLRGELELQLLRLEEQHAQSECMLLLLCGLLLLHDCLHSSQLRIQVRHIPLHGLAHFRHGSQVLLQARKGEVVVCGRTDRGSLCRTQVEIEGIVDGIHINLTAAAAAATAAASDGHCIT